MIRLLLRHQWFEILRHPSWNKNLTANIIFAILFLLMFLNLLALGLSIDKILEIINPDKNPVAVFNSFLLYYFILDFIVRLLFQGVPSLSIKPYLTLPVKRRLLIHYLLSKSFGSLFPYVPLLVLVPFTTKILLNYYSVEVAILWLISMFLLFHFVTFIVCYIKRKIVLNPSFVVGIVLLFVAAIIIEQYSLFSLSDVSVFVFTQFLLNPVFVLISLLLLISIYYLNYNYLSSHIYPEEFVIKQSGKNSIKEYEYFGRYGEVGDLISLELKLIFRNKRLKSTIYFMFAFLILAWPFYKYYMPEFEGKPKFVNYQQEPVNKTNSEECIVNFVVIPEIQPPLKQVTITGNDIKLGEWYPDKVPLHLSEDSTWTRSFIFNKNTKLEYKITGAIWDNEALYEEGIIPEAFNLTVKQDTTIMIHVKTWNTASEDVFLGSFLLYGTIFLVGAFILGYGQFLLGWEGSYFDLLLARKIDYTKYFKAKFVIMVISTLIIFILLLPAVIYGVTVLYFLISTLLFNLGFSTHFLLFMASSSATKMDLKAGLFSMQGKGGQQMLNVLIIILAPAIVYGFTASKFGSATALIIISCVGILGIIFHPLILNSAVKRFIKRRYILGAAFRQQ